MASRHICVRAVWHQNAKHYGTLAAEQDGAVKGTSVKGALIFQPKDIMR
jgi:hypothetical protein